MWLIILSVGLCLLAAGGIVMMTAAGGKSKRVRQRLSQLDQEFSPVISRELVTDIRRDAVEMSAIPLLNFWLTRLNLGPASALYLYQADVNLSFGNLLLISVSGAIVAGVLLYFRFGSTGPALLLALMCLGAPFLYVRRKRAKRLAVLEAQLPEALAMMASALRVGHSLIASLSTVAQESAEPIGSEMRKCFDEQNFGIDIRTALVNLTVRVPIQDFRIFVAAVLIQKESGGNLAEVLEKVAQTTRERFRLKKQVAVHSAQGRMTGRILSIMPVALGLVMYFINPDSMSVLWKNSLGLKMLYTAIGMDVTGVLIIRRIVAIRA